MDYVIYYNTNVSYYISAEIDSEGQVERYVAPFDLEDLLAAGVEDMVEIPESYLLSLIAEYDYAVLEEMGVDINSIEAPKSSKAVVNKIVNLYQKEVLFKDNLLSLESCDGEVSFYVNNNCLVDGCFNSMKDRVRASLIGIKLFKEFVATLEAGTKLYCYVSNGDGQEAGRVSLYRKLGFSEVNEANQQFYTV